MINLITDALWLTGQIYLKSFADTRISILCNLQLRLIYVQFQNR